MQIKNSFSEGALSNTFHLRSEDKKTSKLMTELDIRNWNQTKHKVEENVRATWGNKEIKLKPP